MIREFYDEITNLRAQLAALTGGKLNPGMMGVAGKNGGGGVQEVEKFIHVEDKEKMKAMED